ncbi:MAG: ABC transporter ATP-binding protein, partial [Mucilaginibacter sp.]
MKITDSIKPFGKNIMRAFWLVWHADVRISVLNILMQLVQAMLPVVSLYFLKKMIEGVQLGKPFEKIVPVIIVFGIAQILLALAAQFAAYITTIH